MRVIGKSANNCSIMENASSRFIFLQFTGTTVFPNFCSICCLRSIVSSEAGFTVLRRIMYGLPTLLHSLTVCCNASSKFSAAISPNEPSVVTITPILECSRITFSVPIAAALENGISSSDHGVFTILIFSPSAKPVASGTRKPTQSTRRILAISCPEKWMVTASFGTNFGSVVIIVLPSADCGSSSIVRSFSLSSFISGNTTSSINRLIKVDFPVRTGPTTPR